MTDDRLMSAGARPALKRGSCRVLWVDVIDRGFVRQIAQKHYRSSWICCRDLCATKCLTRQRDTFQDFEDILPDDTASKNFTVFFLAFCFWEEKKNLSFFQWSVDDKK